MFDALQNAAAGLLSSANRAAIAAQNVVVAAQSQFSAAGTDSADLTRGNTAYQLAAQSGNISRRLPTSGWHSSSFSGMADLPNDFQNPPKSLEEALIDLKIAAQAYKANAAVFRTINKTTGTLLEMKL